ncbi:hypothetical protein CMU68_10560 [Elizabethkingia anophelis]|nr:hypothetical protein [Elizabethkingia anophelis]MDV3585634.1 hypothetical protein [Elizabethkingia anophelis]MDV3678803.1 hypothetical protein [Elizabethkingia anophelis]
MNIQDFTKKAQDLVQSTDYKLQVVVLATDGKDISTVNYGTDDMRARMIADYLSKESDEFFDTVVEFINGEK